MLQFQDAVDRLPTAEPSRERLERALDQAELVMRKGRERVKDLRSAPGEKSGLLDELAGIARQLESLSNSQFRLSVQGSA